MAICPALAFLEKDYAMANDILPAMMTVPEAGKYLGISRWAAYQAAAKGELPTIRIGKLLRVPVRALETMLDRVGKAPQAA
jgi:excisionase family DNA binding protein